MAPAPLGELDEALRRGRVQGDRLLEDEVLAGFKGGSRELDVGPVRGAHVDDIDRRVVEERADVCRRVCHSERRRPRPCPLPIRAGDRDDLPVAAPADGIDVEWPDESGPDDRRSDEAHRVASAGARS